MTTPQYAVIKLCLNVETVLYIETFEIKKAVIVILNNYGFLFMAQARKGLSENELTVFARLLILTASCHWHRQTTCAYVHAQIVDY